MAVRRADREIPDAWRAAVARHLAAWVEKQPKGRRTDRALAASLGLSNFTYNRLKNQSGPLGLHVLITLRAKLGVTLDELLGLEPLTETLDDRIRRLLREERDNPPVTESPTHAPARPRPARPRRGLHE